MTSNAELESECVLVLAPLGRDAMLTCEVLSRNGIAAIACSDIHELCARANEAGAAVITAEALSPDARLALVTRQRNEEPWSDLPILVFSSHGARAGVDDVRAFGNTTLLERPVALRTLVSAVEAALRARRRQYQARHAIRQRDNFLAMLGHELRNPLAAITLAVAGLERSAEPERVARHVGVVKRQSENLGRLVDDLLDVARVTTGRIELSRQPLDLNDLVEGCVGAFEQTARTSGLTLSLRRAPGVVVVVGDGMRLEQVFNNLLANAIKYTPAGGAVDVVIEASARFVSVHVKDTGVGIAAETLPLVFDLFVQAPATLDRSQGGLGIGLTVVKGLVSLHGGTVAAHSGGGTPGTELVVRLPRTAVAVAVAAAADVLRVSQHRRRVLIVDDSEDVRESLREILEDLGHEVITAADGTGGLARLLELVPTVAIIDIGLPGIDGYEVARAARQALGDRVRLVALTGYGQPDDKARSRGAGFDEHFTKPVDIRALEILLA